MKTLQEALSKMEGPNGAGQSLRKHFKAVGINDWEDITRSAIYEFHDHLTGTLAPSTARTICSYAKSLFNRYCDEVDLPMGWEQILVAKASKPMKTYLTEDELKKVADAPVHTRKQTLVKNLFLICAYTGLRVSDAMSLTTENIVDGNLHYVAKKTKKAGAIPLKAGLEERIKWVSEHKDLTITLKSYNQAVRKMCKDVGIDDEVVVLKAGKEMKGPKWKYITSHTARISTATCLSKRGVPVGDIMTLLQHSGTSMTERYIVRDRVELSPKAMAFFY
jgi:integrase